MTFAATITSSSSSSPPSSSWIERWTKHKEIYEVSLLAAPESKGENDHDDAGTTTGTAGKVEQPRQQWKKGNSIGSSSDSSPTSEVLTYVLRGLTTDSTTIVDDEEKAQAQSKTSISIQEWSNFCASVFAYKKFNPPPPSYFFRHYMNDPDRVSPSLIRVATTAIQEKNSMDDGREDPAQIVASVRIFLRRLSIGKKSSAFIWAGGIGEVCTSEEHRRRGLSRRLLETAIQMMKELPQLDVSLLHAGPIFQPVYEKFGYISTRTDWSKLRIKYSVLRQKYRDLLQAMDHHEGRVAVNDEISRETPPTFSVRKASFPQDTARLMELHHRYSEQRLTGCIIRTKEYWKDYMSVELDKSLFVLVQEEAGGDVDDKNIEKQDQGNDGIINVSSRPKERIVAWLSIRPREDHFQLREFGIDTEGTNSHCTTQTNNQNTKKKLKTFDAMCTLLAHSLNIRHEEENGISKTDRNQNDNSSIYRDRTNDGTVCVLIPRFVMDEIKSQAEKTWKAAGDGGIDHHVETTDTPCPTSSNPSTDRQEDKADKYNNCDGSVIDHGWMYLNLSNTPAAIEFIQNLQDQSSTATDHSQQHMIWPSDSF